MIDSASLRRIVSFDLDDVFKGEYFAELGKRGKAISLAPSSSLRVRTQKQA